MADNTEIGVTTLSCDSNTSENRSTTSTSEQNLLLEPELQSNISRNNDSKSSWDDYQSKEQDNEKKPLTSRASSAPTCTICLSPLKNKCFPNNCSHTFCLQCLQKWSKIKPECPLCKVHFESIIHNMRSATDFDQYKVASNARSRSRRPSGGPPSHLRTYRPPAIEYASLNTVTIPFIYPTVSSGILQQQTPSNTEFRRSVYAENLWAKETALRGCVTPEFFNSHFECIYRLFPWLTRELQVLLDDEHPVNFVLEFILSVMLRYDIRSEEFISHVQPYIGSRTPHFAHEFYIFAASLFNLDMYDECIQYDTRTSSAISSSENEVVVLTSSNSNDEYSSGIAFTSLPTNSSGNSFSPLPSSSSDNKQKYIPKICLKKNQEKVKSKSGPFSHPPISIRPSTSSKLNVPIASNSKFDKSPEDPFLTLLDVTESKEKKSVCITVSSDDDDDEITIIAQLKPKLMPSHEIIDLSSDCEQMDETEHVTSSPNLNPFSDGSSADEY